MKKYPDCTFKIISSNTLLMKETFPLILTINLDSKELG